ncbi:ABC transporter permease [Rhodococcus sp. NPDC056516]|uniref:ABC transporter permease n=1 Tax=Rhodococcus sp. NPDC056516 TaxID=3345847 RepID=UPI00366E89EE
MTGIDMTDRSIAVKRQHRPVGRIVLRRLAQAPIVLLIVSAAVFWLVQIVPGDPGRVALGQYATPEQVAQWNADNGLDGSILERYLGWLGGFVTGDWGTSLAYGEPVRELVIERLLNSVFLGVYAFVLTALIGIAVGLWQAFRAGKRSDRALTMSLVSLSSTPEFAVGTLLLVVFAVFLRWFPVHSAIPDDASIAARLTVTTLPALTLAAATVGYVARMVRAGTIETLRAPFYRTAVLKGLPRRRIVSAHVTRNSLVPSVAVLGGQFAYLIGGSAVVETLFSYPGIGLTIVEAAQKKDLILLEGAIMVTALASLLVLLVTDLVYMALDPRIDLSQEQRV